MKYVIMILGFGLSSVLIGCGAGGAEGAADILNAPGAGAGTPIPVSVSRKTGTDFECVLLNGDKELWCRSTGAPDARLGLGVTPGGYILYVSSTSVLTDFETWDSTVCISANVSLTPWNRLPGHATYCFGSASLGVNYSGYQIVYAPPFSNVLHGTPELTFAETPFAGGDISMDVMTDTGGTWLVMLDSSVSVIEENLSCDEDLGVVTCPNFVVDTN